MRSRLGELLYGFLVVGRHAPAAISYLEREWASTFSRNVVDLVTASTIGPASSWRQRVLRRVYPTSCVHAAAHGLPVVCTRLLQTQLGWSAGRELLADDSADGFADACATLHSDSVRLA